MNDSAPSRTKTRSARVATVNRSTSETSIEGTINLDGTGRATIETGIGFFNHMLTALAKHSRIDITLKCNGDLDVDDHHTVEDCALVLGSAIDQALGDRAGISRFASAYVPLDEALARVVIDLSGRPWCEAHCDLQREQVGTLSCENVPHFFRSLAQTLRAAIHVDVIRGENDHHRIEASFKACAVALRSAVRVDENRAGEVPSTKGVL